MSLVAAQAASAAARAYELVSPPGKGFSFGQLAFDVAVAAPDGDGVAFNAFGPLPGSESGNIENFYMARRGAVGWSSSALMPPERPKPGGVTYPRAQGFSSGLSKFMLQTLDPVLTDDAVPGVSELYARDTTTNAYTLLTSGNVGDHADFTSFMGASDDFTHVGLDALDELVPGSQLSPSPGAYEWVNGTLRYVGVLPDGTSAAISHIGGARIANAISRDGRRIVFWASDGQLYIRKDGASTTEVSASKRGTPDPNGGGQATYWGASADSRTVVFTSNAELTDDANTGTDGSGNPTDAGNDLYRYDNATGTLTDLSVDTEPGDAATGAAVQGVLGVSDDAAYVYYVALGDLGGGAVPGSPNLYLWHAGETKFIGTLSWADSAAWTATLTGPSGVTSRTTGDGRYLAFVSSLPLTGYDNTDPATSTAYSEVFRYSADDNRLVCVSCKAEGDAAHGASWITPPDFAANITRNLSNDGEVFFDSADDLVAQDTNGKTDVYEYAGAGLHLISTGTSRYDAFFQDASDSGDDVFFSTYASLVPQDDDDLIDLYDARVGGGFGVGAAAACTATLCESQGSGAGAHDASPPASIGLNGRGNIVERRLAAPTFRLHQITATERRRAARTGRIRVTVEATEAGRLSARIRATIGGELRTVGRATRLLTHGGTVQLTVPLSAGARRALNRHGRLRLGITVTYSKVAAAKRTTVPLHR